MSAVNPPSSSANLSPEVIRTSRNTPGTSQPLNRRRIRARVTVIAALIGGLVLSGVARQWALGLQTKAYLAGPYADPSGASTEQAAAVSTAGSLDSYFLVLMLGGLRGPLVMYLWSSSENQKNEKDLEDFNTKVNLIRLLQPEFISVHIFQAWNLAYNISVQIASLPDRYATILNAVEYANQVARSRRNDVNALLILNQLYQQKLGQTAQDSTYYRIQVRKDSKYRPPDPSRAVGTLAQRMDPVLGKDDQIQDQLLGLDASHQPIRGITPRPADLKTRIFLPTSRVPDLQKVADSLQISLPKTNTSGVERETIVLLAEGDARRLQEVFNPIDLAYVYDDWNDGSELQYLHQYGPYPYGVSPLAIGFNYGKRSQVLVNRTKQRPSQYTASVVDSRPALELREWAKEERDRGLAAEARALGRQAYAAQFSKWVQSGPVRSTDDTNLSPAMNSGIDLVDLVSRFISDPTKLPPPRLPADRVDDQTAEKLGNLLASATHPSTGGLTADLEETLYSYRQAARLIQDARAEFIRHLNNPEEGIRRLQDFTSQTDELSPDQLIAEADHDFLLAQLPDEGQNHPGLFGLPKVTGRSALLARAAEKYQQAIHWQHYINLRYYLPKEITQLLLPPAQAGDPFRQLIYTAMESPRAGMARFHMKRLPEYNRWPDAGGIAMPHFPPREAEEDIARDPARLEAIYDSVMKATNISSRFDMNRDSRLEGQPIEIRATFRLKQIQQLLGDSSGSVVPAATSPATQPTTVPATLPAS